jgi:hypothetical protein
VGGDKEGAEKYGEGLGELYRNNLGSRDAVIVAVVSLRSCASLWPYTYTTDFHVRCFCLRIVEFFAPKSRSWCKALEHCYWLNLSG